MKSTSNLELLEQEICISCGICCDGTLYNKASLEPEEQGDLPDKIKESYMTLNEKAYFKLPCKYFDKKCSIYNQKKARICSAYRCELLINFSNDKIALNDALQIVKNAKTQRTDLINAYNSLIEDYSPKTFHDLLLRFRSNEESKALKKIPRPELEILISRFKILESLFFKYFKSEKNFDSMIARGKTKKNE